MKPTNFMPFLIVSFFSICCIIVFSLISQNQENTIEKSTVDKSTTQEISSDEPVLKTLFEEVNLDVKKILIGHTWRLIIHDYTVFMTFSPATFKLRIITPAKPELDFQVKGTWVTLENNEVMFEYFDHGRQTGIIHVQSETKFLYGIAIYELYGT